MSQLTASASGEEYTYLIGYYGFIFLVIGVLSYCTNSLFFRTSLLTFSLVIATAVFYMQFWIPKRRTRAVWCFVLGLFTMLSFRFMFSTLIPIWVTIPTTWASFFLGVVSAGLLSNDPEFLCLTEETDPDNQIETSRNPKNASWIDTIRFALGFGALFFNTHWLLTAHGLVARWIGVSPFYYGIAMMIAFVAGLLLWNHETFVRSPYWYIVGVVSAVFILIFPANISWVFGLVVTTFITSLWSVAVNDLTSHSYMVPALLIAIASYSIFHFSIAWSVAWCFVPEGTGGPFMRQRAGQVFTFSMFLVGLAYFKTSSSYFLQKIKNTEKLNRITPQMYLSLFVIVLLVTTPAILKRSYNHGNYDGRGVQKEYISGAIWAIRFGYDNFGWPNFYDVSRKIKEVGANTIGLVETDTYRPFNGNRDIVEYLEESLHMYSDYGPSTLNDTWGCALLTVFPIVRIERINQPSPDGEVACLIDATLNVNGKHIDVFVTHFGNTQHSRDRHLQARSIAHRVEAKKKAGIPTVWLGYLTDRPGGPNYQQLTNAGLTDVSPKELERYCLYLFHMGMTVSDFKRIEMTEDISDTEIQMASFKLK